MTSKILLITIDGDPFQLFKLDRHVSLDCLNRATLVGQPGDYVLLDRWMNAVIYSEAEIASLLPNSGMIDNAKDGE